MPLHRSLESQSVFVLAYQALGKYHREQQRAARVSELVLRLIDNYQGMPLSIVPKPEELQDYRAASQLIDSSGLGSLVEKNGEFTYNPNLIRKQEQPPKPAPRGPATPEKK